MKTRRKYALLPTTRTRAPGSSGNAHRTSSPPAWNTRGVYSCPKNFTTESKTREKGHNVARKPHFNKGGKRKPLSLAHRQKIARGLARVKGPTADFDPYEKVGKKPGSNNKPPKATKAPGAKKLPKGVKATKDPNVVASKARTAPALQDRDLPPNNVSGGGRQASPDYLDKSKIRQEPGYQDNLEIMRDMVADPAAAQRFLNRLEKNRQAATIDHGPDPETGDYGRNRSNQRAALRDEALAEDLGLIKAKQRATAADAAKAVDDNAKAAAKRNQERKQARMAEQKARQEKRAAEQKAEQEKRDKERARKQAEQEKQRAAQAELERKRAEQEQKRAEQAARDAMNALRGNDPGDDRTPTEKTRDAEHAREEAVEQAVDEATRARRAQFANTDDDQLDAELAGILGRWDDNLNPDNDLNYDAPWEREQDRQRMSALIDEIEARRAEQNANYFDWNDLDDAKAQIEHPTADELGTAEQNHFKEVSGDRAAEEELRDHFSAVAQSAQDEAARAEQAGDTKTAQEARRRAKKAAKSHAAMEAQMRETYPDYDRPFYHVDDDQFGELISTLNSVPDADLTPFIKQQRDDAEQEALYRNFDGALDNQIADMNIRDAMKLAKQYDQFTTKDELVDRMAMQGNERPAVYKESGAYQTAYNNWLTDLAVKYNNELGDKGFDMSGYDGYSYFQDLASDARGHDKRAGRSLDQLISNNLNANALSPEARTAFQNIGFLPNEKNFRRHLRGEQLNPYTEDSVKETTSMGGKTKRRTRAQIEQERQWKAVTAGMTRKEAKEYRAKMNRERFEREKADAANRAEQRNKMGADLHAQLGDDWKKSGNTATRDGIKIGPNLEGDAYIVQQDGKRNKNHDTLEAALADVNKRTGTTTARKAQPANTDTKPDAATRSATAAATPRDTKPATTGDFTAEELAHAAELQKTEPAYKNMTPEKIARVERALNGARKAQEQRNPDTPQSTREKNTPAPAATTAQAPAERNTDKRQAAKPTATKTAQRAEFTAAEQKKLDDIKANKPDRNAPERAQHDYDRAKAELELLDKIEQFEKQYADDKRKRRGDNVSTKQEEKTLAKAQAQREKSQAKLERAKARLDKAKTKATKPDTTPERTPDATPETTPESAPGNNTYTINPTNPQARDGNNALTMADLTAQFGGKGTNLTPKGYAAVRAHAKSLDDKQLKAAYKEARADVNTNNVPRAARNAYSQELERRGLKPRQGENTTGRTRTNNTAQERTTPNRTTRQEQNDRDRAARDEQKARAAEEAEKRTQAEDNNYTSDNGQKFTPTERTRLSDDNGPLNGEQFKKWLDDNNLWLNDDNAVPFKVERTRDLKGGHVKLTGKDADGNTRQVKYSRLDQQGVATRKATGAPNLNGNNGLNSKSEPAKKDTTVLTGKPDTKARKLVKIGNERGKTTWRKEGDEVTSERGTIWVRDDDYRTIPGHPLSGEQKVFTDPMEAMAYIEGLETHEERRTRREMERLAQGNTQPAATRPRRGAAPFTQADVAEGETLNNDGTITRKGQTIRRTKQGYQFTTPGSPQIIETPDIDAARRSIDTRTAEETNAKQRLRANEESDNAAAARRNRDGFIMQGRQEAAQDRAAQSEDKPAVKPSPATKPAPKPARPAKPAAEGAPAPKLPATITPQDVDFIEGDATIYGVEMETPKAATSDRGNTITANLKTLAAATGTDNTLPALTRVRARDMGDGNVELVATDRFRLVRAIIPGTLKVNGAHERLDKNNEVLIHRDIIKQLAKDKNIQRLDITAEETRDPARPYEGNGIRPATVNGIPTTDDTSINPPNVEPLYKRGDKNDGEATFNKAQAVAVLREAKRDVKTVDLTLKDGQLHFDWEDRHGDTYHAAIPAEGTTTTGDYVGRFNAKYLRDALQNSHTSNGQVSLLTRKAKGKDRESLNTPRLIVPADQKDNAEPDNLTLIMPGRPTSELGGNYIYPGDTREQRLRSRAKRYADPGQETWKQLRAAKKRKDNAGNADQFDGTRGLQATAPEPQTPPAPETPAEPEDDASAALTAAAKHLATPEGKAQFRKDADTALRSWVNGGTPRNEARTNANIDALKQAIQRQGGDPEVISYSTLQDTGFNSREWIRSNDPNKIADSLHKFAEVEKSERGDTNTTPEQIESARKELAEAEHKYTTAMRAAEAADYFKQADRDEPRVTAQRHRDARNNPGEAFEPQPGDVFTYTNHAGVEQGPVVLHGYVKNRGTYLTGSPEGLGTVYITPAEYLNAHRANLPTVHQPTEEELRAWDNDRDDRERLNAKSAQRAQELSGTRGLQSTAPETTAPARTVEDTPTGAAANRTAQDLIDDPAKIADTSTPALVTATREISGDTTDRGYITPAEKRARDAARDELTKRAPAQEVNGQRIIGHADNLVVHDDGTITTADGERREIPEGKFTQLGDGRVATRATDGTTLIYEDTAHANADAHKYEGGKGTYADKARAQFGAGALDGTAGLDSAEIDYREFMGDFMKTADDLPIRYSGDEIKPGMVDTGNKVQTKYGDLTVKATARDGVLTNSPGMAEDNPDDFIFWPYNALTMDTPFSVEPGRYTPTMDKELAGQHKETDYPRVTVTADNRAEALTTAQLKERGWKPKDLTALGKDKTLKSRWKNGVINGMGDDTTGEYDGMNVNLYHRARVEAYEADHPEKNLGEHRATPTPEVDGLQFERVEARATGKPRFEVTNLPDYTDNANKFNAWVDTEGKLNVVPRDNAGEADLPELDNLRNRLQARLDGKEDPGPRTPAPDTTAPGTDTAPTTGGRDTTDKIVGYKIIDRAAKEWGITGPDLQIGDKVTARNRRGRESIVTVTEIVSEKDGQQLARFTKESGGGRGKGDDKKPTAPTGPRNTDKPARGATRAEKPRLADGADPYTGKPADDTDEKVKQARAAYKPKPEEKKLHTAGLYFNALGAWHTRQPAQRHLRYNSGYTSDGDTLVAIGGREIYTPAGNLQVQKNGKIVVDGINTRTGQPEKIKSTEYGSFGNDPVTVYTRPAGDRYLEFTTPQNYHALEDVAEKYPRYTGDRAKDTPMAAVKNKLATEIVKSDPSADKAPEITDEMAIQYARDNVAKMGNGYTDSDPIPEPQESLMGDGGNLNPHIPITTRNGAIAAVRGPEGDYLINSGEATRLPAAHDPARAAEYQGRLKRDLIDDPDARIIVGGKGDTSFARVEKVESFGYGFKLTARDENGKRHTVKFNYGGYQPEAIWKPLTHDNGQPYDRDETAEYLRLRHERNEADSKRRSTVPDLAVVAEEDYKRLGKQLNDLQASGGDLSFDDPEPETTPAPGGQPHKKGEPFTVDNLKEGEELTATGAIRRGDYTILQRDAANGKPGYAIMEQFDNHRLGKPTATKSLDKVRAEIDRLQAQRDAKKAKANGSPTEQFPDLAFMQAGQLQLIAAGVGPKAQAAQQLLRERGL